MHVPQSSGLEQKLTFLSYLPCCALWGCIVLGMVEAIIARFDFPLLICLFWLLRLTALVVSNIKWPLFGWLSLQQSALLSTTSHTKLNRTHRYHHVQQQHRAMQLHLHVSFALRQFNDWFLTVRQQLQLPGW
ncbi:hypothetical protein EV702DRAFT_295911 [Suillus placidus]|uniref:Uncharacterized protein n=1 Tax=Suillus placidus TaxID=48579 RepID=A0A9P7D2Q6_9AGAM|nr:hypothetical protein EV702DRAFT_295911 [Suillus placidus]